VRDRSGDSTCCRSGRIEASNEIQPLPNLRRLASVVEVHQLGSKKWARSIYEFRKTGRNEAPPELLRAAAEVRGRDMTPNELATWLRGRACEMEVANG
jgi:hypothetical protein